MLTFPPYLVKQGLSVNPELTHMACQAIALPRQLAASAFPGWTCALTTSPSPTPSPQHPHPAVFPVLYDPDAGTQAATRMYCQLLLRGFPKTAVAGDRKEEISLCLPFPVVMKYLDKSNLTEKGFV